MRYCSLLETDVNDLRFKLFVARLQSCCSLTTDIFEFNLKQLYEMTVLGHSSTFSRLSMKQCVLICKSSVRDIGTLYIVSYMTQYS